MKNSRNLILFFLLCVLITTMSYASESDNESVTIDNGQPRIVSYKDENGYDPQIAIDEALIGEDQEFVPKGEEVGGDVKLVPDKTSAGVEAEFIPDENDVEFDPTSAPDGTSVEE